MPGDLPVGGGFATPTLNTHGSDAIITAAANEVVAWLARLTPEWSLFDTTRLSPVATQALWILCGAGCVEERVTGRAWTDVSALDFEAIVSGVWVDAARRSVLPDELRRAIPAWGKSAVSVQLRNTVEVRLTHFGTQTKQTVAASGGRGLLEYLASRPVRGRASVRILGGEGQAPGGDTTPKALDKIADSLQAIAQSQSTIAQAQQAIATATERIADSAKGGDGEAPRVVAKKPKRSTNNGDAVDKLIAALTEHHQYATGGCLHWEPIGVRSLAEKAAVSPSTASEFFERNFGGHRAYRRMCRDSSELTAYLQILNRETPQKNLFGRRPPGEGPDGDDDE